MEKYASLRNLKISLLLILLFWKTLLLAQANYKDTLELSSEITSFSQDQAGNFYLALKGGVISKYGPSLDSLLSYSPSKLGDITLLEAWHGFKIFAFYQDLQDFTILDRFLTRDSRYTLSQSTSNFIDMCAYSRDQNLWAVEENQLRLLKINLSLREIEVEVPLEFILASEDHKISFIKEYQNLIFINDEYSGIYIFDNLGNYLRKIQGTGIQHCSFYKDKIYFIKKSQIHILSLYKDEQELIDLPSAEYLGALAHKDQLLVVTKQRLFRLELE